ncbi:hypothetical protein SLOPH_773 [Spraguea lophii 42_110]|uniref:Uncharacterized protein n=1 Tax=Spraguea lophii (strain 42_110) TaxID=1358809 RepID=S7XUA9_SPRLO|nr:hypothetical protein SLOPH_773 [Spraguea lophii 42_110]
MVYIFWFLFKLALTGFTEYIHWLILSYALGSYDFVYDTRRHHPPGFLKILNLFLATMLTVSQINTRIAITTGKYYFNLLIRPSCKTRLNYIIQPHILNSHSLLFLFH